MTAQGERCSWCFEAGTDEQLKADALRAAAADLADLPGQLGVAAWLAARADRIEGKR